MHVRLLRVTTTGSCWCARLRLHGLPGSSLFAASAGSEACLQKQCV